MIARKKTRAELDAENRWRNNLSREQKDAYLALDKKMEENKHKEKMKTIFGVILLVVYFTVGLVPPAVIMFIWWLKG